MIYLTATGQPPGGSSLVHICIQIIQKCHKTNNTQNNTKIHRTKPKILSRCTHTAEINQFKKNDMIYLLTAIGFTTRWQQYSTHLHTNNTYNNTIDTNNTQNNTKIHRTTQIIHTATQQLGRVRAVPRLCGFYIRVYIYMYIYI